MVKMKKNKTYNLFLLPTMSCPICADTFNLTTRKTIGCNTCAHTCCLTCTKTYLLQSVNQPHCMSCRGVWTQEWLTKNLPASFLKKDYRNMREKVLMEEEKKYLPACQAEAERCIKLNDIDTHMNIQLLAKHNNHMNENQMVFEQRQKGQVILQAMADLDTQRVALLTRRSTTQRHEFVMPCPLGECRGFMNAQYKCGLCATHICKECHYTKTDTHVCDPNEVATVIELRQNTKPCPKCNAPIFKIDGCDQMFCIRDQCHTAFSWRTGHIETGVIHNPEYFAALRNGVIRDPRHHEHPECGLPGFARTSRYARNHLSPPDQQMFEWFYQQTSHHRQVTMVRLTRRPDRTGDRVAYLMGKLDEKKFKQRLFVTDQRNMRYTEEQQILESYLSICEELFRGHVNDGGKNTIITLEQLHRVTIITYDAVATLEKKYQHKGVLMVIRNDGETYIRARD